MVLVYEEDMNFFDDIFYENTKVYNINGFFQEVVLVF